MNHLLSATALVATLAFTPAIANANNYGNAHERCKRAEDNRQILGGFAGAVLGGVIGSQVAGRGARTEGSVIAGTIGALAGAGIADKSIDCDPVYPEQRTYSSGTTYSPPPTYSSGTTYSGGSTTYSSTPVYEDRVTVSNHPVYSDPYYGAGAVSQGTTYSTGTTTYPPSGSNSQYVSNTYTAPSTTYTAPVTTYTPPATTYYSPPATTTYVSRPTTTHYSPSYSSYSHNPQFRTVSTSTYGSSRRARRHGSHYHGRYSCDMGH